MPWVRATLCTWVLLLSTAGSALAGGAGGGSALGSEPIPMKTKEELPSRTPPIIEIGPDFLGTGNIGPGIELPTGAVWQPALWVFGDLRTATQYFDNGPEEEVQEWVTRLELFFNVQLTATERLLFGVSPLRRNANFTGYRRKPDGPNGFSEFNFDTTALFFEGEFGEIFPNLDPDDTGSLDIGFSIGRQALFFQEGMMMDDTIDFPRADARHDRAAGPFAGHAAHAALRMGRYRAGQQRSR